MGRSVGDEDEKWPVWGRIDVSSDVAAELKREQQFIEATRRTEEDRAIPRMIAEETPAVALPTPGLLTDWNGPTLQLFSWRELVQDRDSVDRRQDPDSRERNSAIHQRLMLRGKYRRLAGLPDDWRAQLDEIESHFPNFTVVVDYLRALFAIAELSATAPHLDPLLLDGPPGVGKSLFAERLGQFFGSGYRRIPMENAQTNAQLAGSDEFWSNSKTGAVFDTLVEGDYANPVLLLDEVDKVHGRMEFDPLGALYGLLEPGTAKSFRDLSMPRIAIDASRIYWLLTSNEADRVPAPILSRVRRFDIPAPQPAQAVVILNNIYDTLKNEMKLPTAMAPLSPNVILVLGRITPRRQRQILREAIGRALYEGRREITTDDLRLPADAEAHERRMGF